MPKVRDLMTTDPATCTPNTSVRDIAQKMVDFDCGAIPVLAGGDDERPIGIVTDRDIVCRLLAEDRDPLQAEARDCMSSPVVTVSCEADLRAARDLMSRHRIRRVVAIEENGACCGVISLSDIVRSLGDVDVVREVSEPTEAPSEVAGTKVPEPA